MEYSRRRERPSYRRKRESSGAGKVLLALLMLAGVVYLVCVSAAGKWLSENVMLPVLAAFRPAEAESTEESGGAAEEALPVSLPVGEESVTGEATLPDAACYALQMGVYSLRENADAAAKALRGEGAAGFVLEDGSRYRVLACGYTEESSAQEVKERLVQEGRDCTVYPLLTGEAAFRVFAAPEQLAGVQAGFSALALSQQALTEAALAFDREEQSMEEGRAAVSAILQKLETDTADLAALSGGGASVTAVLDCCGSIRSALALLAAYPAESTVDFSAEMKYTQLYTTHEYRKLMESLS